MPRYFLSVRDRDGLIEDREGAEFANLDEAKNEGLISARELMAEKLKAGDEPNGRTIEIADEGGKIVASLNFHDAIRWKS